MKLRPLYELTRLNRPVGIWLFLWPTYAALWMSSAGGGGYRWWVYTLEVILLRSAGCVVNDILDRSFDRKVSRTQHRPLAMNLVSIKSAWILFLMLMFLSFLLSLTLTIWSHAYVIALLSFSIVTYPLLKRIFPVPQLWMGFTVHMSIPITWLEVTGSVPMIAWLDYGLCIAWAVGYDTFYALVDQSDDRLIGVRSSAIFFHPHGPLIACALHLIYMVGHACMLKGAWIIGSYLSISFVLWCIQVRLCQNKKYFKAFSISHRFALIWALWVVLESPSELFLS